MSENKKVLKLKNYAKEIDPDLLPVYRNENPHGVLHPSRYFVIGGSNSGKTSWVINALMTPGLRGSFDEIWVCAKLSDEALYAMLERKFQELGMKHDEFKDYCKISNDLADLPDVTEIPDDGKQRCVIIDDNGNEDRKEVKKNVANWFQMCRKKNVTLFYIAQAYTALPPSVRGSVSAVVLYYFPSISIIDAIAQNLSFIDPDDLRMLYKIATSKKYGHLWLDSAQTDELKVRIGRAEAIYPLKEFFATEEGRRYPEERKHLKHLMGINDAEDEIDIMGIDPSRERETSEDNVDVEIPDDEDISVFLKKVREEGEKEEKEKKPKKKKK